MAPSYAKRDGNGGDDAPCRDRDLLNAGHVQIAGMIHPLHYSIGRDGWLTAARPMDFVRRLRWRVTRGEIRIEDLLKVAKHGSGKNVYLCDHDFQ